MDNAQADHWGNNYYLFVDDLHFESYKTLEDVYKGLGPAMAEASGKVLIQTRDNWLSQMEEIYVV